MARCPRCADVVPAYARCRECGLVLGFEGITVLIEVEESVHFRRVWRLARTESSCSVWAEENGRRFLRVTYAAAQFTAFEKLATAGAQLSRKHVFLNGLEIRWPATEDGGRSCKDPCQQLCWRQSLCPCWAGLSIAGTPAR